MAPSKNLLVVDDDLATRTNLSHIFAMLGYSVRTAEDGFSALALIRDSPPDILLSDLNMPGMSGFELLSVVRRNHPAIHVIASSGAFSGKEVPEGIAADAFYEKATGLQNLFALVENGTQSALPPNRSSHATAPIWMKPAGRLPTNEVYMLIACPHCLRVFPQLLGETRLVICETDCLHCDVTITYAIVQSEDFTFGSTAKRSGIGSSAELANGMYVAAQRAPARHTATQSRFAPEL